MRGIAVLTYLAVLWAMTLPVLSQEPIGVFVTGDMIPDQAFLHYDPALRYTTIPFPTVTLTFFEDQAEAMARHIRMYIPRLTGTEGRFWETFEEKYQFVINLPYLQSYYLQDSPYYEARNRLMMYMSGAVLNGQISELTAPSLAQSSGLDTALPFRGRLVQTCPGCPLGEDPIHDVPFDLLGGRPSKSFTLNIENETIFEEFGGTGIENYHDATLILLAHPLTATKIPITINITGALKARLNTALSNDPGALRDGIIPWLMYCNISKTAEFRKNVEEVFKHAGGLTWTCASPLNGPFFFPRGGYIASTPAFDPRHPPSISKVSISEEHPYAWDIISTIIYYSCSRDIPDLLMVHETRTRFAEYWTRYIDILHVLDWVEKWRQGPVVQVVWRDLEQVEKKKTQATLLYIEENYAESDRQIQQALDIVAQAEKHAKMSLTEALSWVYFIESCTVTSTALIAGSITLYFVSAKRTTKVGETRLRPRMADSEG